MEGPLAQFRHQGGNLPSEATGAQNLVLAPYQLASCPFPILSLKENAPKLPSCNQQPESKIPISQTPLHPGPRLGLPPVAVMRGSRRAASSVRTHSFGKSPPSSETSFSSGGERLLPTLVQVPQGRAAQKPRRARSHSRKSSPRHPLCGALEARFLAFQSDLVSLQRTASPPGKCISITEHKSFRTSRLCFKRPFDFYM